MSDTISIVNQELHGIFAQEDRQENNTAMLRFAAGLYLHAGVKSDYQGRYTSSSGAFDAGSVDGVRIYVHPDFVRNRDRSWGMNDNDSYRSRLGSRSTKPKVLLVFNQQPRGQSYPNDPTNDMPAGNYTPTRNGITFIDDDGVHLGCLQISTGGRQTYRLLAYNNPIVEQVTGETVLEIDGTLRLTKLILRATPIIKQRASDDLTGNFTFVDLMKYATQEEGEFIGYSSEYDIGAISKRQVDQRIRTMTNEHRNAVASMAGIARNLSLAVLEKERLDSTPNNIVDLNKVDHPYIDMVYVETQHNVNYPIIKILTKMMAFFPDGGLENYRGYDKEMGVPVGRFTITIDFNNENVVTFKNESYSRGVDGYSSNMQHPHIFQAGDACWGNFGETLSDLIMQFDIVGLIDLAMLFIQQANYRDAAGHCWPRWANTNIYPKLVEEYKTQELRQPEAA